MMTESDKPHTSLRQTDSVNDDDEQRIRERIKAKIDSRRDNTKNGSTNSGTGEKEAAAKQKKVNDTKVSSPQESSKETKDDKNGANGHGRRRRHRGKRSRRGGGGAAPPSGGAPPHLNNRGFPRRGSHSPPGPPPRAGYGPGPGYRAPPGMYGARDYPPPPPHYGGGGPPPMYGGYDWRGSRPPPGPRYVGDGMMVDDFGRRPPPHRRSYSRSRSPHGEGGGPYNRGRKRSYSRSRSRSGDRRRGRRSRSLSTSSSVSTSSASLSSSASSRSSRSSKSSRSSTRSSSESSRSYSEAESKSSKGSVPQDDGFTKDQRTVFVTQLVRRTTEKDIARFFRKNGLKTNEIILLRDKRTGLHKGSAYVELRRMEDLVKSLGLSGKPPDFQRFPILIKSSEAEKNYLLGNKVGGGSVAVVGGTGTSSSIPLPTGPPPAPPMVGPNGKLIQAQKLYVGNLDPSVSQEHLFALFNPFGQLEQVTLQKNEAGVSKGFAFLQFRDPKEANLALQTMSGRMLAGRPIKTGWANQVSANPNVDVVISQEFPEDSTNRAQTAYMVLAQLTAAASVTTGLVGATSLLVSPSTESSSISASSRVPTVAEARASLAAAQGSARLIASTIPAVSVVTAASDATKIGNAENPTKTVLVYNMFNKDEETDPGWENDIRDEFQEECSKYGTILTVIVMHTEPGGKIYATFDSVTGAQNCASNLAGRWFDKRQLRVEFVPDSDIPV